MLSLVPFLLAAPAPAAAQQTPDELRRQAEQMLGRPLTDQEITQFLEQSGMSPEQIRQRLSERGVDPSLADPYLTAMQGRQQQVPEGETTAMQRAQIVSALGGAQGRTGAGQDGRRDTLGLGFPGLPGLPGGAETPQSRILQDIRLQEMLERRERERGPPVFGREMFLRATSQFDPVTTGPVPDSYRLGPGDQIVLVITGAVEQSYERTVGPNGSILIPEVGRIFAAGKSLGELEETLFDRLSQVYSGITRGPDATTFFDVTLGELRTNQVYTIGEVERPGAYEVGSLATVLTALYRAGGPSRSGSFRNVRVRRGDSTAARLDLYEYLVEGNAEGDIRLEQGDVVFVPTARNRVRLQGPVRRPGIYAFEEGETLEDIIRYAGGLEPEATVRRVQVERIADAEGELGRQRRILDVSVEAVTGEREDGFELRAGDRITLFAVLEDVRNQVTVSGGVWRPGTYSAGEETRLWDVLRRAGGLLPDALEGRAQIQRLRDDYTRRMIPVSLARDSAGDPVDNPPLDGMDQIIVFARRGLRDDLAVSVGGWVREPGVYPYVRGMTVADLILKAGGLRTGAYTAEAEVARLVLSQSRTDTLTRRYQVALDSSYVFGPGEEPGEASAASLGGEASGFELRNLDAVYVRRSPGFEPQQRVMVTGEVSFPGPYSIQTRSERLTDLVDRAGGLTDEAYVEGFQLWRTEPVDPADTLTAAEIAGRAVGGEAARRARPDTLARYVGGREAGAADDTAPPPAGGEEPDARRFERTRVGIDFPRALRNPGSDENVLVEPGDSIHVPHFTPTVAVRGAVGRETQVLWREGAGLGFYIDQAGGYTQVADEDRVRVQFANGEVATRGGGFLFFGGGVPDPDPGSVITVPAKPERERGGGINFTQMIPIITSIMGSITTIVVATN